MYISGRERIILSRLLIAGEEIAVKDLAENLDVSERTIHRDLKKIEDTLENFHLKIVKKIGKGIRIEGRNEDKEALQSVLTGDTATDFTPDERKTIILTMLLERKEPLKLFALADELQVTSATVSSDLDQLEVELASFGLSIARKKGLGIVIEGKEAKKRSVLSHLISQHMNPIGLASHLKDHIQKQRITNRISDRLFGYVNPNALSIIEKRVEHVRKELPYELADDGYIGLVVHLALAIERIKKGDVIQFDPKYLHEIEGSYEYGIAKKLIDALKVDLSMEIPDDEIGYITMHLLGAKLRTSRNHFMEEASLDIAVKANELIRHVSKQLNKDLSDNKLLHDLTVHLKPAIFRLKQGMPIKNPMIKEIKRDYFDFFQIVQKSVEETFPELVFPEDEIGYLVLHFAATLLQVEGKSNLKALVICSSGIGTSKILASKLLQKIPEIRTVENKSLFELENAVVDEYDVIISTVPLEGIDDHYILTSPMLTETETHRIKKEIRKKALVSKREKQTQEINRESFRKLEAVQNYSKVMVDVLRLFKIGQAREDENQSVESVLYSICMELVESKIITKNEAVLEKLLQREKQGGLGIPNTSLTLYHTRSNHILVPCFQIYTLNDSLKVRGMDGEIMETKRILLMLVPELTNNEVLEIFSFISSLIIQGQESIHLFEQGTEQQLKQFLSDQFYTFLDEKISM